jgi:hypothetical protein
MRMRIGAEKLNPPRQFDRDRLDPVIVSDCLSDKGYALASDRDKVNPFQPKPLATDKCHIGE